MRLWRLSSERRARDFDGGYGVSNDGRWNTRGRRVTYCSTVASLTALEKRVHVTDPALLPPQILVTYELPDSISRRTIEIDDLPADWTVRETHTQAIGDQWLDSKAAALLFVPSVIVPIAAFLIAMC
jgi:RES domain-containing protein